MRASIHLLTLTGLLLAAQPSHAILGLFEDESPRVAPNASTLANQEQTARARFDEARGAQSQGRLERAREIHEGIVRDFPFTQTAATSQFEVAKLREAEGDLLKAFDEYQKFIENYKQSELFGEAIRSQFELATRAMNGRASSFLFLSTKTQPSRVIELYEQVAANAPFSRYAPLAIYNIGILQMENGRREEAMVAFQRVVDEYPTDPKKVEAQARIIEIQQGQNTRDDSEIEDALINMELFISQNEEHPKSDQYRAEIGKLEERDAEKTYNIGRYYESKGNPKAAAIYYKDVQAGTARFADAQARLEEMKSTDPNLVLPASAPKEKVQAPVNVVERPDYYGPPPPELVAPEKPKMRASEEDVLPLPVPTAGQ